MEDGIVKTHVKDYIKIFDSKFFTKQQCQSIINSLDDSTKTPHVFYKAETDKGEKTGNDPQISLLKKEKKESMGNLIQSQWYKIACAYVLDWLNKKEKDEMVWRFYRLCFSQISRV